MKTLQDLEQDSNPWHQRRLISIGSSDAAVVMNADPYRNYDQLLAEKRGSPRKFEMNEAMRLGKKWEGPARESFNLVYDMDVEPLVGVHDDHDFILASFDGLCHDPDVFVEIKYIGHKKLDALKHTKELPFHHYIQMQHQFLVSGFTKAFYVAYALAVDKKSITRIEFIEIKRSDEFINEKLLPAELEFWKLVHA